jgi:GntR family transcriptional regulator/MocR family aminotransferase
MKRPFSRDLNLSRSFRRKETPLATRTLLNPGEAAWLENPGYFGARGALLAAGAHLIPIPVNEQGEQAV